MLKERLNKIIEEYFSLTKEIPLALHYVFNFSISQNVEEMMQVIDYLGDRKFNNFVELGSANGGSLWLYSQLLCLDGAIVTSVDPGDRWDLRLVIEKLQEKNKNVKWIKEHSYSVVDNFKDNEIDLLHIDAEYRGVYSDWLMWYPKVKKNGIILIHGTYCQDAPASLRVKLEKENYNIKTFKHDLYTLGISLIQK